MSEELDRSARLIETLLADPALRARFRAEPVAVLAEHGLGSLAAELPAGERALRTLELRESRSSLAGMMLAAAAEGVDFAHVVERAAPGLEHEVRHALSALDRRATPVRTHEPSQPPQVSGGDAIPPLATAPEHAADGHVSPADPADRARSGAELGAGRHHGAAAAGELAAGTGHEDLLRYPGNAAGSRRIAAWMAAAARRAGLPPELPVMAALTESGLRNLDYGDRDSVGFFQMRLGIWNAGPYAGYPDHPELQLKWFIDHALAVKAQDPGIDRGPNSWGEWVASVEQPAAAYRGRYQLQLPMAEELLRHAELGGTGGGLAEHAAEPVRDAALRVAERYLGTPYQWGGTSPQTGFDCSGLVQYAYGRAGIALPRVAAEQFDVGVPVPRDELRPGDAVFFADPNGYIHHVGLYVGGGRFIDAPQTGQRVQIDSLSEPYFAAQYAGARRYSAATLADPTRYARSLPTIDRS